MLVILLLLLNAFRLIVLLLNVFVLLFGEYVPLGEEGGEGGAEGAAKNKDQEACEAAANQAHVGKQEEVMIDAIVRNFMQPPPSRVPGMLRGWWSNGYIDCCGR